MTDRQPCPEDPGRRRGADRLAPRPPAVAPLLTPRAVDAVRLIWWLQLGFLHGMSKGSPGGRLLSGVLWFGWWPAFPLVVSMQTLMLGSRRSRYYLSPGRDAVLAIRVTGRGWLVEAHQSSRPGTGAGRALRARLVPTLVDAADRDNVAIYTTAATARLAARYATELPGLVEVGRGWPRGRRLRRAPGGSGIAAQSGTLATE